jgi:putative two-component system response regulator
MKVLVVDDNAVNLQLLGTLVGRVTGRPPTCMTDAAAALAHALGDPQDLVLVDYMMPELDGLQFIERLRQSAATRDAPIVMVTTAHAAEIRQRALALGATDFLTKPIDSVELRLRVRNLLALRRSQNLLADRAALLAAEVRSATADVLAREEELVMRLARAAESRDPETGGHIQRMAHYSVLIARSLGLGAAYRQRLFSAAPMHDIGKVGTPDHVLLKPGRLTDDELVQMRQHASIGERILGDSTSPLLQMACQIAGAHHERWDGSGYPRGLAGHAIPLAARIVAVADVLDALTSVRPYKPAWPLDAARAHIERGRGSHFDPRCVDALLDAWDDVPAIRQRFPD